MKQLLKLLKSAVCVCTSKTVYHNAKHATTCRASGVVAGRVGFVRRAALATRARAPPPPRSADRDRDERGGPLTQRLPLGPRCRTRSRCSCASVTSIFCICICICASENKRLPRCLMRQQEAQHALGTDRGVTTPPPSFIDVPRIFLQVRRHVSVVDQP